MAVSILVDHSDCTVTATAAIRAKAAGDIDSARHLDRIARKMAFALTVHKVAGQAKHGRTSVETIMHWRGRTWRDMPSNIGD